jgi:hypothetical protein
MHPSPAEILATVFFGLAVQNVLENMLAVHSGLEECWALWFRSQLFPHSQALRDWVQGTGELPAAIPALGLRYLLTGQGVTVATRSGLAEDSARVRSPIEVRLSDDGKVVHLYERYADSSAAVAHLLTFGKTYGGRFMSMVDRNTLQTISKIDSARTITRRCSELETSQLMRPYFETKNSVPNNSAVPTVTI